MSPQIIIVISYAVPYLGTISDRSTVFVPYIGQNVRHISRMNIGDQVLWNLKIYFYSTTLNSSLESVSLHIVPTNCNYKFFCPWKWIACKFSGAIMCSELKYFAEVSLLQFYYCWNICTVLIRIIFVYV